MEARTDFTYTYDSDGNGPHAVERRLRNYANQLGAELTSFYETDGYGHIEGGGIVATFVYGRSTLVASADNEDILVARVRQMFDF